MSIKVICVAGARPNFMKIAPLFRAFREDADFTLKLVHTGQHYDDRMSGQFFRELHLPDPDHNLGVGSGSHAQQTAEVMKRLEPILVQETPDAVLVVGDVNSTMASAIVAAKLNIPVIHVEAGLRSFDRTMPEEINRVITDAITDVFLVSEESGRKNLLHEGAPSDRIHLVGNLMIDSLVFALPRARCSDIHERLGIQGKFGLVTLHRPSGVDDDRQLSEFLEALAEISQDLPLYFPVHPRTSERLQHVSVKGRIHPIEPLGYLDFLALMEKSSAVFTDSGGIQEETTALGVPCLTLRTNTERPATVELGTNTIAGTTLASVLEAWETNRSHPKTGRLPPFWDGNTASRCRVVLRRHFGLMII